MIFHWKVKYGVYRIHSKHHPRSFEYRLFGQNMSPLELGYGLNHASTLWPACRECTQACTPVDRGDPMILLYSFQVKRYRDRLFQIIKQKKIRSDHKEAVYCLCLRQLKYLPPNPAPKCHITWNVIPYKCLETFSRNQLQQNISINQSGNATAR